MMSKNNTVYYSLKYNILKHFPMLRETCFVINIFSVKNILVLYYTQMSLDPVGEVLVQVHAARPITEGEVRRRRIT